MTNVFHTLIARFLQIPEGQVERTIGLLNEGATIPFISRYRKEVTGGLDEVQIGAIKDQLDKLTELSKRKETILATIEEQEKLTPELRKRIEESWDSTEIEDLKEGQVLPGIVTNITNFGCFVDVGIKENGLVHISELADRFVSDPTQVVSIHQHVKVKVLSVDLSRKRVQLSMKGI